MRTMRCRWATGGRLGLYALLACLAFPASAAVPVVDKGDSAWMLVATTLVMLMIVPGLALFYGGLVRAKNILSVLMQVLVVAALALVLWVAYGYSLAFDGGNAVVGGFGKLFLRGVDAGSTIATFTPGVWIPELAYVAFQGAFAAISCALV
ncbi:MAG: ammonia channel protein, partial [Luteimonas sp.]